MPSDENSREETDCCVLQEDESDLVRHSTCAVTSNISDCFDQDKYEQKRVIDMSLSTKLSPLDDTWLCLSPDLY